MSMAQGRNKYRAKPTDYNGVRYASLTEAGYAQVLDTLIQFGEVRWWLGQPRFRLGVPENVYVPDFLVFPASGCEYAVDVKGVETPKFRKDKKLWAAYGPCPLVVIARKNRRYVTRETINPKENHL